MKMQYENIKMVKYMLEKEIRSFADARDYILDIPKFSGKNTLEDTKCFYQILGNPGEKQKIVHVAGTNGKGSVCAYLSNLLQGGGYGVGVFTSPHLISICERFRIGNQIVTEEEFLEAFLHVKKALSDIKKEKTKWGTNYHPSFFEWLFFMAMIIFEEKKVEFIILETGLGGRLDATNAVNKKELCIITQIGLDHMEYLGNTLEEIAYEKAGIIREHIPVIYWDSHNGATKVIEDYVERNKCEGISVDKDQFNFLQRKNKTIDFSINSRYHGYISLNMGTLAKYQMENVAIAIASVEMLDYKHTITTEIIQKSVHNTKWEGRMEEIRPDVFVDGAHNLDGIEAFLSSVRMLDNEKEENHLLFSVVNDKQYDKMIEKLACSGLFSSITLTSVGDKRMVPGYRLEEIFNQYVKKPVAYAEDVREAFTISLSNKGEKDKLYIVGSLYLVGEIKSFVQEE